MTLIVSKPQINLRDQLNLNDFNVGYVGKKILESNDPSELHTFTRPGFRNLIINGDFDIWQRGTSFNNSAIWTADRWAQGNGNTDRVTTNSGYALKHTSLSSDPYVYQTIEDPSMKLVGEFITISFHLKTSTGINRLQYLTVDTVNYFHVEQGSGLGGIVEVPSELSDEGYRKFVLTAPLNSAFTGYHKIIFEFDPGNGSSGAISYLKRVQAEIGTVATPFEFRPFSLELMLCQRFYENSWYPTTSPNTNVFYLSTCYKQTVTTNDVFTSVPYKVQKRATPTTTIYNPNTGTVNELYKTASGSGANISVVSALTSPYTLSYINTSTNISAGDYVYFHFSAQAEIA